MAAPVELPFGIGRWSRFVLLPWGVRAGHRSVLCRDDTLEVRFGWLTTTVAAADIERWDITGPYRWHRAIGIRHTPFGHDISCCGDASGAIRLWLWAPRRIAFVRHTTQVFLGIQDPTALGAWLTEHGISGEDLRGA